MKWNKLVLVGVPGVHVLVELSGVHNGAFRDNSFGSLGYMKQGPKRPLGYIQTIKRLFLLNWSIRVVKPFFLIQRFCF